MEIKKKSGSFNAYNVELSWGQLEAIKVALEKDHADPLSDELFQGVVWYMNGNLPVPGEDPKDKKKADDGEGDDLLDAPPGEDGGTPPTVSRGDGGENRGPDDEDGGDDGPERNPDGEEGGEGSPGEPGEADADDLLPSPPEE